MNRKQGQPKSGTKAYARNYAKKNRRRLNEQAKKRMSNFRKRQRIAWAIAVKEVDRLTPASRKRIKALTGN